MHGEATRKENLEAWILEFVASLRESCRSYRELLEDKIDKYSEFAELYAQQRMAIFWPLILKTYRADNKDGKEDFRRCCRLMEVFCFRAFSISRMRIDAGQTIIYALARDYDKDSFPHWSWSLWHMSRKWNLDKRFHEQLTSPWLVNDALAGTRYLLWRYENELRRRPGRQHPPILWRQYLGIDASSAIKYTIEHITPQSDPIVESKVTWQGKEGKFEDIALHALGNVVLDTHSSNSSKSNKSFADKYDSMSKNSTLLSQGELNTWAKDNEGRLEWPLESIMERHRDMLEWAKDIWNPDRYYKPSSDDPAPTLSDENYEEEGEDDE